MKIKLQPHHIAEIRSRLDARLADFRPVSADDMRALLEHIEAIEEELHEADAFLASLPPIQWRDLEEVKP
jgi:hypothetical protein